MNNQQNLLLRLSVFLLLTSSVSIFCAEKLEAKRSILMDLTIRKVVDEDDTNDKPLFEVVGRFVDSKTKIPVMGVEVSIINRRNSRFQTRLTSADGMFRFELSDQAVYSITGSKQKFFESEQINISTEGKKEYEFMKVEMPIEEIIENKEYLLEEITFGINSNELDDASIASVQQVCKILRKNPTLSVEIGVHTDSRGSDEYNLTLSQKRANSILSVFQKLGIRDGRLKVKGYGETTLLNQCGNNVKCGSTAHNENRRVSMKILEF